MQAILISFAMFLGLIGGQQHIVMNPYQPNSYPPENVRASFYVKSVEVLNFYVNKVEAKSAFTDSDNDYLLGYYRSMPSHSTEELEIKGSLTFLDLAYRDFDYALKGKQADQMASSLKEFNVKLQEALKLLEIALPTAESE